MRNMTNMDKIRESAKSKVTDKLLAVSKKFWATNNRESRQHFQNRIDYLENVKAFCELRSTVEI